MALNFRRFTSGIQIIPRSDGSTATTLQGELSVSSVDGNIYYNTGTSIVILDGTTSSNTLLNKTIPVGSNFITSTPNTAAQFNASTGDLESSVTTDTELAYVHGVTSSIQGQLNAITGSSITSLVGQVTATGPGASTATIATNTVTNSNLTQMPTLTLKGNNTGSTANAMDLTVSQVNAMLGVSSFTFPDSVVNTAGAITLKNDTSTPGDLMYYGTNGSGTLGYYAISNSFPTIFGSRSSPRNISASVGITVADGDMSASVTSQIIFVNGSGGSVTITASPAIQAGTTVGQTMTIIGRNNTNTLEIPNQSGLVELNGNCVLGLGDALNLLFDGTVWTELSRS
jgi:hypothetical protein